MVGSFERLKREDTGKKNISRGEKLIEIKQFGAEAPVGRRGVSILEWSPNHPELFLSVFSGSSDMSWDPKASHGLVHIYSTQMPSTPEAIFTCHSEVTSCVFHPFEPSIVIGGTAAGYLVKWDMRVKSSLPILRGP